MFFLGYYFYLINPQSIKSNKSITEIPFIPVIYTYCQARPFNSFGKFFVLNFFKTGFKTVTLLLLPNGL